MIPDVEPAAHPAVSPAGNEPAPETAAEEPLFSVVKGQPTDVELAALTAVVLSLGNAEPEGDAKPSVRHWVRRQQLRLAPTPGPGAWKRSRG
ncbi:acyl-CoA carboxylase subunit epsilon [Arthrobacter sp. Leaf337]|uniref:acyl-CoA carboxylase subunit epsilon n=1 Tax=Arthrobacter sp. Leaf337 TaxID=1736342 RepID=UPI000B2EA162